MDIRMYFTLSSTLFILFKTVTANDLPGPSTITHYPQRAIKNSEIILTCNTRYLGKPPATIYRWFSNQIELSEETSKKIHIKNITSQISNFSCAAANQVGSGEFAYTTISVMAPPRFIKQLPDTYLVSDKSTSVILTCQVECSPNCIVFWLKDGEILTNTNPLYQMKVEIAGPNHKLNQLSSVITTLSFNLTAWPNGHLTKRVDDAIYSCMSSSNGVNRGVTSSTKFNVQYPPENIVLSKQHIDVPELTILYNITCEADGSPEPSYSWKYKDVVLSSYRFLYSHHPLRRDEGGVYTCTASNEYGNVSSSVFVNVLYEPSCQVVKREDESRVELTCQVTDGNPSEVSFQWVMTGVDHYVHTELNERENPLIFFKDPYNDNYGNFTCIVSNYVGRSECTFYIMETETEDSTTETVTDDAITEMENEVTETETEVTETAETETKVTETETEVTETEVTETEVTETEVTETEVTETETETKVTETAETETEVTETETETEVTETEVTETEVTETETATEVTEAEVTETETEVIETETETETENEVTETDTEVTETETEITEPEYETTESATDMNVIVTEVTGITNNDITETNQEEKTTKAQSEPNETKPETQEIKNEITNKPETDKSDKSQATTTRTLCNANIVIISAFLIITNL